MSQLQRRPFVVWPGWNHLISAWVLTFVVSLWFGFVFAGTDWITAHHGLRVRVHLPGELSIPLVPWFTVFYMSIYALFFAAPFVLRSQPEIINLAISQTLAIFLAGICFLLIPASLDYQPPTDSELGIWKGVFDFADRLNLDYNLLPSLHVALSIICIEYFAGRADRFGKALLRAWGVMIAASTILTHQHHLLDAASGYLLAFAVMKLVRSRNN
jgi:hypothetical protein